MRLRTRAGALLALASFSLFTGDVRAQLPVGTSASFTQNYDSLAASGATITWTNGSTIQGWYAFDSASGATGPITTYRASDGSTASASIGLNSFGSTGASERALGSIASTTTQTIQYGLVLSNNLNVEVTQFHLIYTGEQWRASNAAAQTLTFDYRTGSNLTSQANFTGGGFTSVTALNFTSPTLGTGGALDGNAAANRTALGATVNLASSWTANHLALRWTDPDDSGTDHGLAVDDFRVQLVRNLVWSGGSGGTAGQWDTASANWQSGSTANNTLAYANANAAIAAALPGAGGDQVRFTDAGLSAPTVTLVGSLSPTAVTVSNTTGTYAFTGSGSIAGATSLTKTGNGDLVLALGNTYSGGTVISGGTVFANNPTGTATGTGSVTINSGGTLRGEGSVAGAVTVNPGGILRGGSSENPITPLTINDAPVNIIGAASNGGVLAVDLNGENTSGDPVGRISLVGENGILNFQTTGAGSGPVVIRLLNDGNLQVNSAYSFVIAGGQAGGFRLNGEIVEEAYTYETDFVLQSSNFEFSNVTLTVSADNEMVLGFTTVPIPEPATVLGIAAASLGLGAVARRQVRRERPPPARG